MTVTRTLYRDIISEFFLPKLDTIDVNDMWFEQDDVRCHTSRERSQFLHPGRVFSYFGDQNWPLTSCDLTLIDFFLCGSKKGQSSMTTSSQPPMSRRKRLNAALTKFSHIYAK